MLRATFSFCAAVAVPGKAASAALIALIISIPRVSLKNELSRRAVAADMAADDEPPLAMARTSVASRWSWRKSLNASAASAWPITGAAAFWAAVRMVVTVEEGEAAVAAAVAARLTTSSTAAVALASPKSKTTLEIRVAGWAGKAP